MRQRIAAILAGAAALAGALPRAAAQAAAAASFPRVPEGFAVERAAGPPDIAFPMFAAFDDRGRLFVAESSGRDLYDALRALTRKCRVSLLEDRDGDGRFETAGVFADQLVFPMGLAWRDGRLYVADPPDLVALQDTDGDGRADRRDVILTGFGHTDNGSLHGLTFGPDGLLYMTMGNPDGYELKRADGSMLRGKSGALIRCRPDGSNPEVLCRGFENLVEVAFTPRGEILGTDNWYRRPSGGIRDALVHLADGGLYPLHADADAPRPVTGEPLPPLALFPPVALSGLALAEGEWLPAEMRGNLFTAQHNSRKVGRHALVPEGATFRTLDHDFVTSDDPDFHPSDVLESADGSLLVVDTGGWYVQHCPTGKIRRSMAKGGIYRVRRAKAEPVEDPWGLRVDWVGASAERLVELLGDRRPAVRDHAQRVQASRGAAAAEPLAAALAGPAGTAAKQRALWALSAIPGDAPLAPLRNLLKGGDLELAATAARALALREDRAAAADLCRLLAAADPRARMAAAEALARCGGADAAPALWRALEDRPDRFLEHALIHAAYRIAGDGDLRAALAHPHHGVQKAALLLLDQPPHAGVDREAVLERAAAADAGLRQAALRILQAHPDWAPHAAGFVRGLLEKAALSEEDRIGLVGLIRAFAAQPALQELVASALGAASGAVTDERRVLVLEAMAQTGLRDVPAAWVEALARSLRHPAPAVRAQAVRAAAVLRAEPLDGALAGLADAAGEPPELRIEALRALAARRPELSPGAFELLLGRLRGGTDPAARLAAAEVLGRSRLSDGEILQVLQAVRGDALVSPAVLLPAVRRAAGPEAAAALVERLEEWIRGGWQPDEAEMLDVLRPLPRSLQARASEVVDLLRGGAERVRDRMAEFEPLLAGGDPARGRLVFFSHKAACATCHRVGPDGGEVGPDLTKVGAVRSGPDILESIVAPSSSFAQGYENYAVTLTDGRAAGGILARQDADAVVLRDSGGAETLIRRDAIEEMKRQPTSIMPEGLERLLAPEEFRDLLGYLQSLK